jgi:hypothetical protein
MEFKKKDLMIEDKSEEGIVKKVLSIPRLPNSGLDTGENGASAALSPSITG